MASSNSVRITSVEEVTLGTTPTTPRMRARRWGPSEGLKYTPTFDTSDEMRDDGTSSDPILTGTDNQGPIAWEFHYPVANSPLDSDIKSALRNTWTNAPAFDNDGTADSVITDAGTTANTYVVASGGAAVKLGHLVRATNFTNAANNQIFRAASSTGTTIVGTALSLTAETAPPATARLKVVGFAGASGDITATSTGLGSTALDFTTLGLVPGQWLKVGGTAAGDKFANIPANNDWVRISGTITATAIPLDNRPSGWAVDNGSGKTIKVWFSDHITNGTTRLGQSIERGFMGQGTPTYILHKGMVATQFSMTFEAKKKIPGSTSFMGMSGTQVTSSQDAVPDAALALSSYPVFACSANVGRIGESGSAVAAPNFVRTFSFNINWNATVADDITQVGPQDVIQHEMSLTGQWGSYFGDNSYLTKFFAGTATSASLRATKASQAFIWQFPRIVYNADGSPNAAGRNQDVMLTMGWKASRDDALTSAQIIFDRFEYFEA